MDEVYADRNRLVQLCAVLAKKCGYTAGVRTPVEDSEWPVVVINLPEGEIAWHIPLNEQRINFSLDQPYDGHTNEVKADRVIKYIQANQSE